MSFRFTSFVVFLFFQSALAHAGLLLTFSENPRGGALLHIEGQGVIGANLGKRVDFFNLSGGDPFATELEEFDLSVDMINFTQASRLTQIRLDSDTSGDDFFLNFDNSLKSGEPFNVNEWLEFNLFDYTLLTPGVYKDETDSESVALGGFQLVIEEAELATAVDAPHSLALFGFVALFVLRKRLR